MKAVNWKFPQNTFFMRLEIATLAMFAVLIFAFSLHLGTWTAALFTALFLAIYVFSAYIIRIVRKVEEKYHLTPTHLEVVRKTRTTTKREKVHFKDLKRHKLDKFFLGGHLQTKEGKRVQLFFNTRKEVEKFEDFLLKHWKKSR